MTPVTAENRPVIERSIPITQEYQAGRDLLKRRRQNEARQMFYRITQELPSNRADAAMSLVGMQEVDKLDERIAATQPISEREKTLGVQNLRNTLNWYPEQQDACALARCKIGEYYLWNYKLPMARYQLERVLTEYPNTSGSRWAKIALIKAHAWSDEWGKAEEYYNSIREDNAAGVATTEQLAWAEHHYLAQRLLTEKKVQEYLDFLDQMSLKYKDSAPEVAARCKNYRYYHMLQQQCPTYVLVKELREQIERHSNVPHITESLKYDLIEILINRGWKQEQRDEAYRLRDEIANRPDALTELHVNPVQSLVGRSEDWKVWEPKRAQRGTQILDNPNFRQPMSGITGWIFYGNHPNWPDCDWIEDRKGFYAGWNTVNCGHPERLEACVVQDKVIADASAPFRLVAHVGAEAWDGGSLDDVIYEMTLEFMNPFDEPLAKFNTGIVKSSGIPKQWDELVLQGVSPEDGYIAKISIRFLSEKGQGHHAVVYKDASLVFEEGNNGF